ncbi:MAG: superoxide dismutase [Ni] [Phycisphaerales bacterium]|jgi:hypothetical protein|nr:superoxide dismutase [Ni] [Phycisphaerales bacterium]
MRRFTIALATVLIALAAMSSDSADAHCQVPCGIYDDAARFAAMREDVVSIRKAMTEIAAQQTTGTVEAFNQATRWVMEKERSAADIQDITSAYFLTQRVKPTDRGVDGHAPYVAQLEAFHAVLIAAMKCKQQIDPANADALDAAIDRAAAAYGG